MKGFGVDTNNVNEEVVLKRHHKNEEKLYKFGTYVVQIEYKVKRRVNV